MYIFLWLAQYLRNFCDNKRYEFLLLWNFQRAYCNIVLLFNLFILGEHASFRRLPGLFHLLLKQVPYEGLDCSMYAIITLFGWYCYTKTQSEKVLFVTYMLWFNFILGLNFNFLCLKLITIHYHTPKQRKINLTQGQNWTTTYTWHISLLSSISFLVILSKCYLFLY